MKTLQNFDIRKIDMTDYYFIAHLLDRVLVGRTGEYPYEELLEGIRLDTLWEAHFFNSEIEIFVARLQDRLVIYKPLEHEKVSKDKVIITRSYQLEERFSSPGETGYDAVEVKEYIDYDEYNLAYVKKTVLYKLKKAGE